MSDPTQQKPEVRWTAPPTREDQALTQDRFHSEEPAPKKKVKPIATLAVILAIVAVFIGGFVADDDEEYGVEEPDIVDHFPGDEVAAETIDGTTYHVYETDCAGTACAYTFGVDSGDETEIAEDVTFYSFDMFDSTVGVVGFAPADGDNNVFVTIDGGESWDEIDLDFDDDVPWEARFLQSVKTRGTPDSPVYEMTFNYPRWIDRSGDGVTFRSADGGNTWEQV